MCYALAANSHNSHQGDLTQQVHEPDQALLAPSHEIEEYCLIRDEWSWPVYLFLTEPQIGPEGLKRIPRDCLSDHSTTLLWPRELYEFTVSVLPHTSKWLIDLLLWLRECTIVLRSNSHSACVWCVSAPAEYWYVLLWIVSLKTLPQLWCISEFSVTVYGESTWRQWSILNDS